MKPLHLLLLNLILLGPAYTQDASKKQTNTHGEGIDTPIERTNFKTALELENVNNTSDINKPISILQAAAIAAAEADANAFSIQRANHTGTQAIATVSGLQAALDGKLSLSGGTMTGDIAMGGNGIDDVGYMNMVGPLASSAVYSATDIQADGGYYGFGGPANFPMGIISAGAVDISGPVNLGGNGIDGLSFITMSGSLYSASSIQADGGYFGVFGGAANFPMGILMSGDLNMNGAPIYGANNVLAGDFAGLGGSPAPFYSGIVMMGGTFDMNSYDIQNANEVSAGSFTSFGSSAYFPVGANLNSSDLVDVGAVVNGGIYLIDFLSNLVSDNVGEQSIDWSNRFLADSASDISINYNNRELLNENGVTVAFDYSGVPSLPIGFTSTGNISVNSPTSIDESFQVRSDYGNVVITGGRIDSTRDIFYLNYNRQDLDLNDGALTIDGPTDDIVMSGDVTHTGEVTAVGVVLDDDTKVVTREVMDKDIHFSADRLRYLTPWLASTPTGGSSTSRGSYIVVQTNTDANAVGKIGIAEHILGTGGSGASWRFDTPFILSGKLHPCITNNFSGIRIQVGTSTDGTVVPLHGADPLAAEQRGIGIEFRKNPSADEFQVRLYARNGYTGTNGTLATSSWVTLAGAGNSYVYSFAYVLEFNNTTQTVNLYGRLTSANDPARSGRISSTPIVTLSGAGVPNDYQNYQTGSTSITGYLIPDGTNLPANGSFLSVFDHKFELVD